MKENSTVTYSVGGLILSNSGAITANYWLSEIYDEEIANAHRKADIHLHDLSMLTGYCAGWSLKQLIQEGLGGIPGKITSSPASHLSTLCNQMVNFLGIMQNEWAGAQAFSSFDTYLAPFVKIDHLSYKEVKQCIQSFVYGVNTPSRWGTQAPFSNITLDWTVRRTLRTSPASSAAVRWTCYRDCKAEMDMVNRAFIEIMIEGDANGRGFQYPIPTYSITRDFDWSETENNKLLFEMTAVRHALLLQLHQLRYGTLRRAQHAAVCVWICASCAKSPAVSSAARAQAPSASSPSICRALRISRPTAGFLPPSRPYDGRFGPLSLKVKRTIITKIDERGPLSYTKRYLGSFENHFSTIGLVGMNEACLNAKWLRSDMTHRGGAGVYKDVLNHMRERSPTIRRSTATSIT